MSKKNKRQSINDRRLSVSSKNVQGFHAPGTGVVIDATGEMIYDDAVVDEMKKDHPWIRAVLKITMKDIVQTQ